jgi:hypothetical protein
MKTKMRWMAGAVLLVLAVAACRDSLVQPDARPSLDKGEWQVPDSTGFPDDTIEDTGYFGSGHYEPANPPPDTTPQ